MEFTSPTEHFRLDNYFESTLLAVSLGDAGNSIHFVVWYANGVEMIPQKKRRLIRGLWAKVMQSSENSTFTNAD